jgi:Spy/CpxP family protein refolding chaperone
MRGTLTIIAVLAAVAPLAAQQLDVPPGRWWAEPQVVERLNLSDEQQETIRDLVYDHARRMIDLKADVERAGLDLAESIKRDEFDPAAVRTAHAAFQSARSKLENERFEMLLAVRGVLSAEQWASIQEMQLQQGKRWPRRPGGQVPPGPSREPRIRN